MPKTGLPTKDLAGVDEFHVRGLEATQELAIKAGLQPGMQVPDIGGAARRMAKPDSSAATAAPADR